jgi:ATP-dependent helicase/nuclease subunit B
VHDVLHRFTSEHPRELPDDVESKLMHLAEQEFAALGASPRVHAFWRPAFQQFARWFAETEPARRAGGAFSHTELRGVIDIPVGGGFRLSARADRIDVAPDGTAAIYDYKTSKPPLPKHVDELFAPQLPLEAAIAMAGGFPGLGRADVTKLSYIHVAGKNDGGDEVRAGRSAPETLAESALESLVHLVRRYQDPDMPYEAKRRSAPAFDRLYRYDDYEHLARIREWLTQETEEEPR